MSGKTRGRRPHAPESPATCAVRGAGTGGVLDFDSFAADFEVRYARRFDYSGVERRLIDAVAGHGAAVLEVGCGTGHWLRIVRSLVKQVAGVDPSPKMLALAKLVVPDADLRVGSAERLPWPDETFDRVFMANSLHLFSDLRSAFSEARRVLRPGGRLLTIGQDPHRGTDEWCVYDYFPRTKEIDRQRYPTCGRIRKLLRESGLCDCGTIEAHRFKATLAATDALASGFLDRHITSSLALLSDKEYSSGLHKVRREAARLEAVGEILMLKADLRFLLTWGTRV